MGVSKKDKRFLWVDPAGLDVSIFTFWGLQGYIRWTPHPVIVTIRDNEDYIKVLLYS